MSGNALFIPFFMAAFLLIAFHVAAVMQLCDRLKRHHSSFFESLGGPSISRPDPQPFQSLSRAFFRGSLFSLRDPTVSFLACLAAALALLASVCILISFYFSFLGRPA